MQDHKADGSICSICGIKPAAYARVRMCRECQTERNRLNRAARKAESNELDKKQIPIGHEARLVALAKRIREHEGIE